MCAYNLNFKKMLETLFLREPGLISAHTEKWFQVLLIVLILLDINHLFVCLFDWLVAFYGLGNPLSYLVTNPIYIYIYIYIYMHVLTVFVVTNSLFGFVAKPSAI